MSGQIVQLGLVRAAPVSVLMDEMRREAEATQARPFISSLAGYVRQAWVDARTAKQQTVEPRMLAAMRARRGEYEPEKLAQIRDQGGSEIYAMLTSVKCRAAASWIRDVLLGQGGEKPWTIRPTPMPELPAKLNDMIVAEASSVIAASMVQGQGLPDSEVLEMIRTAHSTALQKTREIARQRAEKMEMKMEDQLVEGGFLDALYAFIDDITTFPAAILKGPVVRRRPTLNWVENPDGRLTAEVQDSLKIEWERVSPFNIYPSPASTGVDGGYLIERHKLSPADLDALIGVEGYDEASIRMVLEQHGRGGLREWLTNDMTIASAEGKSTTAVNNNPDHLIDALQYWGSVQGKLLREWGMGEDQVPDPTKTYHVECWLIGNTVIKAVLNYDPLHRKPYFKASYEEIPGSFWGNSVSDLVRDTQSVVNAAARALVNNMGMASGPQVGVNVDRLPPGEDINTLTPWRIWQFTSDPTGNGGAPLTFFQPQSNVAELLTVFEKFSQLADEYSGIPRYLTGETTGGAGRTASGLSMLISNAGKAIKQVIANIDTLVMKPLLERLYIHNMRFADDPDLKGDVNIVARGANSLIAKESAQVRRNEFLATTANPVDMQIVGIEGRAAILRETAKNLDMDPDKIVPPLDVLRQKLRTQAVAMLPPPGGQSATGPSPNGQQLMDGAPATDNFSPPRG